MHYQHTVPTDAPASVRVYRYRLTDHGDRWLTMISPRDDDDDDIEAVRRFLDGQFGPERVLEVEEEGSQ